MRLASLGHTGGPTRLKSPECVVPLCTEIYENNYRFPLVYIPKRPVPGPAWRDPLVPGRPERDPITYRPLGGALSPPALVPPALSCPPSPPLPSDPCSLSAPLPAAYLDWIQAVFFRFFTHVLGPSTTTHSSTSRTAGSPPRRRQARRRRREGSLTVPITGKARQRSLRTFCRAAVSDPSAFPRAHVPRPRTAGPDSALGATALPASEGCSLWAGAAHCPPSAAATTWPISSVSSLATP